MSTFLGIIEEIPGISVDRFNNYFFSSVFFLSHCHADHMEGLNERFFQHLYDKQHYLYCTPISKIILLNIHKLSGHLANTIRTIDGCAPIVINYRHKIQTLHLTVTSIPAGHCPGSIMFLFEKNQDSILYTGDFRIDIDDLSKFKPLHNILNGKSIPKKFETIYLDTTFFNSDFYYFPSRQEALVEICKVVHSWISQNDKNIVVLECSGNYGPEHLFIELSKVLGIRVHVKKKVFRSYTLIPELANCITNDPYASQIHACMNKNIRNIVKCRPDIPSQYIITVVPSALRWKNIDSTKNIFEWDEGGKRFYACYSCHSSRAELEIFIKYFRPIKLHPCVCPKEISLKDFQNQLNQVFLASETNSCYHYNVNLSRYKSHNKVESKALSLSDDDD